MSLEEPPDRAERDPSLLRASHADRDRIVEILRDAAADGRLDTDELEERVERALTARTFADLEPLTEDLTIATPAPPAAADAEVERLNVIGQRLRREGAWTVPRIIDLSLAGGSALLDYTVARLPADGQSTLRISMYGGSVRLTVPPGVAVDLSGISTQGGRVRDKVSRHAVPGEAVTHVITVTGLMVGGRVRVEASDSK